MAASPSSVLTQGLGVWGTPSLLVTLGFGSGSAPPSPPVARSPGGSGKRYPRLWKLKPWEAPKVWKKIKVVEKKKKKTEDEIEALAAEIRATQNRLQLAKLQATAQRLAMQIEALQADIAELKQLHKDLEDEEAQLMLIIASLY